MYRFWLHTWTLFDNFQLDCLGLIFWIACIGFKVAEHQENITTLMAQSDKKS